MTLVWRPDYNGTPGKVTLAKEFTWNESVWNPSMISTALWLDAADATTVITVSGNVSQWNDKSGNRRHLEQADSAKRPSYSTTAINQKPALVFDGSNDLFEYNSPVIGTTGSIFGVTSYGNTSLANQVVWWSDAFLTVPMYFVQLNSGTVRGYNANYYNAGSYSAATPEILNNFAEPGNSAVYRNGVLAGSISASIGRSTGLHIGGSSRFGVAADVTIAELIAVDGVVDSSARQRIEGYLAHKWGLTGNLPAGHPYKLVGPTP